MDTTPTGDAAPAGPPPTLLTTPTPPPTGGDLTPPAPPAGNQDLLSSSPKDWKLPPDLEGWKSHEKYPTAVEFVRSYKEMERTLSSRQQVKPPGADAKPEEIAAWNKLLGVPETPEGYGLKAPEKMPDGVQWNPEFAKEFSAAAHKSGMNPAQVAAMVDLHMGNISKIVAQGGEMQKAEQDKAIAALRQEWGSEFAGKINDAAAMMREAGLDPSNPKFGNDPELAKAMANLAGRFKPSGSLVTAPSVMSSQTTQKEAIMKGDDYQGKNGVEKQNQALAQVMRLSEALKPGSTQMARR